MSSEIFPTLRSPNWKLTRTPTWSTLAHTSSTGDRRRVPLRAKPLWRWTLKNAVLQSAATIADLQTIHDFFNARAGQLDSFLWLDPEPGSITLDADTSSVLGSYWPVAFTVDTIDFERFSYQLWQAGTVSFTQIALNTDELGDLSGAGTLVHGDIVSMEFVAITSHLPSSTAAGYASIFVSSATTPQAWGDSSTGDFGYHIHDLSAWTSRTDSLVTATGLSLSDALSTVISFRIHGGIGATDPDEFRIHDCYAIATYSDAATATLRPTRNGTATNGFTNFSTVISDAGKAVNSNPSDYASIVMPTWGIFAQYSTELQFTDFR